MFSELLNEKCSLKIPQLIRLTCSFFQHVRCSAHQSLKAPDEMQFYLMLHTVYTKLSGRWIFDYLVMMLMRFY